MLKPGDRVFRGDSPTVHAVRRWYEYPEYSCGETLCGLPLGPPARYAPEPVTCKRCLRAKAKEAK
jgi:hypothetical protein